MIYYTLPEFYFNHNIINVLTNLDFYYYKFPVVFECATGNFPFCYFNGGYNNNIGKGALYDDFATLGDSLNIPLCFNLSNIFIEEKDFKNTQMNLILSLNETGSNSIEFSNLNLYLYLKEKYPNYIYIFSKQAFLLCPDITPEQLDQLIVENQIDYISLDEIHSIDLEYLKQIKNKKNIKLAATAECNVECNRFINCRIQQHQKQYDFSNYNCYIDCNNYIPYQYKKNIITFEEANNFYKPLGFNHFTLGNIISDNVDNFILFFIDYFIKDEYKYELIYKFKDEGIL